MICEVNAMGGYGNRKSEVPHWAREVEPEVWRGRILRLEDPLRGAVAAVVYWDVFSCRMYSERWDHLDDLLGRADAVGVQELYEGLLRVGYLERRARNRVWPTQNACARGRRKLSK